MSCDALSGEFQDGRGASGATVHCSSVQYSNTDTCYCMHQSSGTSAQMLNV